MYIYIANALALIFFHYFFLKYRNIIIETYCWFFTIFFLTLFIGLRYEVGGDWVHYTRYFYSYGLGHETITLIDKFNLGLFFIFNKFAYYTGIQFVGVNFITSLIFMLALAIFLNNSRNRWLALAISFPIIIVILGMGYSRQGLAFAFSLLLLRSLEDRKLFVSIIYLLLAIISHKSALLFSVIFIFYFCYYKNHLYLSFLVILPIFFGIIFFDEFERLTYFYIGSGQHMFSYGSFPRSLLFFIVASLFLFLKEKYVDMTDYQVFIYTCFSFMVVLIFPFSLLASVGTDRLLLFFYALKIVFVSYANLKDKTVNIIIFLTIGIYFFYFLTWLFFGANAYSWVPYNFITFDDSLKTMDVLNTPHEYLEVEKPKLIIEGDK